MAGKKGMLIKKNHEDSPKFAEYYKKEHPEWSNEECENKAQWFKRSCNYQCIEYYERKYPELSYEEHLKIKENLIEQKRNNSKTNIKYWIKRYPEKSLEELEELRSKVAKENNKCNIEYWIKKYPEKTLEELKILHLSFYKSWYKKQEGRGKGEKNCNSKQNTTQQQRNANSPRNIAFYERKYPELSHEEHLKLLQDFFNKNALAIKHAVKTTNIEYYLNQGMSEQEAKLALHKRQTTFSLEKCIKKYGEIEGLKKFSDRQQKWLKNLQHNFTKNGDGRSPQSQFAKDIIKKCCKYLNISIPKKEKYIYDQKFNRAYSYDFLFKNKIIEFQGDYWHCNPNLYDASFYNKTKKQIAKDIWEYDKQKLECANLYGYDVLYIWEYDYNKNKEESINKCIQFLTT